MNECTSMYPLPFFINDQEFGKIEELFFSVKAVELLEGSLLSISAVAIIQQGTTIILGSRNDNETFIILKCDSLYTLGMAAFLLGTVGVELFRDRWNVAIWPERN
ncbi:MAG TPA: hypothetical protein VFV08_05155 [Puia sp.]|nr:hypothetical protein [Puia sp.]